MKGGTLFSNEEIDYVPRKVFSEVHSKKSTLEKVLPEEIDIKNYNSQLIIKNTSSKLNEINFNETDNHLLSTTLTNIKIDLNKTIFEKLPDGINGIFTPSSNKHQQNVNVNTFINNNFPIVDVSISNSSYGINEDDISLHSINSHSRSHSHSHNSNDYMSNYNSSQNTLIDDLSKKINLNNNNNNNSLRISNNAFINEGLCCKSKHSIGNKQQQINFVGMIVSYYDNGKELALPLYDDDIVYNGNKEIINDIISYEKEENAQEGLNKVLYDLKQGIEDYIDQ
jgi:hypothetical protein